MGCGPSKVSKTAISKQAMMLNQSAPPKKNLTIQITDSNAETGTLYGTPAILIREPTVLYANHSL